MKIEIKNCLSAKILFSAEVDNIKLAVELAVKQRADLKGAYLKGADLKGAYLTGAGLKGGKLDNGEIIDDNERPFFALGPIGSAQRTLFAFSTKQGIRLRAGCFFGSTEEFLAKLKATHSDNNHAKEYKAALVMIEAHFNIWKKSK